jgi:hypothetical protein
VPPASRSDLELSLYRPATAVTKIELAALAALGPRRLVRADPLEPELAVDINELFSFLKASKLPHWTPGMTGTPEARTIAARLLHPPLESDNDTWAKILASASDDDLDSHGFDEDARRAISARDWKAALEARVLRVQHIVSEFVAQRARWGENDRPSLEYLAVDSTQP